MTNLTSILENHRLWLLDPSEGSRADLRFANLRDADLRYANLRDANLWNADLRNANLRCADLWGADLRDAYLRYADLQGADLRYAILRGADLWGANLRFTNLRFANLRGANLRGANLQDANLRNADLRLAGLWGADLRNADLRNANLRGAGLRDANLRGADLGIVPTIDSPHVRILREIKANPDCFDVTAWHSNCGTTHCYAGWVVTLAGDEGAVMEDRVGTAVAASLILAKSCPHIDRIPNFHDTNDGAIATIERYAAIESE